MANRSIAALDLLDAEQMDHPRVLYLRGQAYRLMHEYRHALPPLQRASELDPENIHVFLALAWSYKRVGRIDQAIDAMKSAVELDCSSAIAQYNLACYFALSGDAPNAIMHLALAFELDSDFRYHVANESDFDAIRNDPRFTAITTLVA